MSLTKQPIKKADFLYDATYASLYNGIWWENDYWKPVGDFHIKTLSHLLASCDNWLDVGCGTGYFLSQFPNVSRSGLDLSKDMLGQAAQANPAASFYHQSMIDKNTDLEGNFDLVTCTGQPWCYLPTLDAIETAVTRLAEWTAADGKCMLTPCDIVDVADIPLPADFYDFPNQHSEKGVMTLGVIWTHKEFDGSYYHLLGPNLDLWVRWFAVHFKRIEILVRPELPNGARVMRRIILCSEKRAEGEDMPATIVVPPVPLHDTLPDSTENPSSKLSNKQLLSELSMRLRSGSLIKSAVKKIIS